ncbi:ureidoglycolate lyase [Acidisoma cellulosilytica]|uniref:Ureidoglycolate lyase n=1 Tax=Acidisoma cellulosilyticum TaxID=2802395 RepID=A0A964E454_9PROT|nr:ureidoglycolate lyase [Acidisoma cellulosilyticum]MCB8881340.1 ureidoglycolate lyase [Acidisoma cellulosilyticum]
MAIAPVALSFLAKPLEPDQGHLVAPFGKLVTMGQTTIAVNDGTALRCDIEKFPAEQAKPGFALITSIYQAKAQSLPRSIDMLERHSQTPQLILPLSGNGHVMVACCSDSDGCPDLSTLRAFRLASSQGIIYDAGIWHHPIIAIDSMAQFLVQSWQNGKPDDCEITKIDQTLVNLDSATVRENGQ